MKEVVIRRWGEIWHVSDDEGSTTTSTFGDALHWGASALEEGGEGIIFRVGLPKD